MALAVPLNCPCTQSGTYIYIYIYICYAAILQLAADYAHNYIIIFFKRWLSYIIMFELYYNVFLFWMNSDALHFK